ncbi:MAG TPA: ABC transporter ATP-binding protein, partial [Chloroflexota bacterium]|nr:ABC transporter ATP-binding protein [Chloroflexota bacterium]
MILSLRRYWRLLMTYLFPHWAQALVMATLLFAGIACQLLGPQVLRSFLDTAVAGGALSVLVASALLFLGVTLLTQVLAVAGTYVAESVGWLATNALRADVALHCLRLDPGFHQGRTPGELVERIDGDINTLATFFSRFVVDIVGSAILLGGVLVLLGREDWRLALATAGFAGVILAVMLRLYATARPIWVAVEQASATFFGLLQEYLGGTEDIRSCGAEGHAMRRFAERLRGWLPLLLRATFAEQAVWMAALSLFALANAVALATGVQLLRAGMITIGTVYLIARYVELLIRPISRLQAQIQDLQKVGASITRVEELLQTRSALPPGAG